MERLGVFFGGKSCEHEVSVITALSAMAELEDKYEIIPVYMCDKGWYTGELLKKADVYKDFDDKLHTKVYLDGNTLYNRGFLGFNRQIATIDVAFICAHGGLGEGGGLAGLLEINNIPYTSCGVLSSAVCMDKEYFKIIAKEKGFKVVSGITIKKHEYESNKEKSLARVLKKLGDSLVVKPVDSGSSVGVSAVKGEVELQNALDVAFCYSGRALIEKKIEPLVEYNCAACTLGSQIIVSAIEKPEKKGNVLSYEDKYLSYSKKGDAVRSPVELPYALANKIRKTTLKLYEEFELSGVVRVDYIYSEQTGELFVNEVNTIPGSLASPLYNECGIEYEILADALIEEAKNKKNREDSYISHFSSELLSGNYRISKMRTEF